MKQYAQQAQKNAKRNVKDRARKIKENAFFGNSSFSSDSQMLQMSNKKSNYKESHKKSLDLGKCDVRPIGISPDIVTPNATQKCNDTISTPVNSGR